MKFDEFPTEAEWKRASSSFMAIRATKPKLVKIDNLVKRYHQVLDMSKLNILMELKNAIIDWAADKIDRGVGTERLDAMQALIDVTVRKLTELDDWGKHRYNKVVCVGYSVNAGDYKLFKNPPKSHERQQHDSEDVLVKCNELIGAIRQANGLHKSYNAHFNIKPDEDQKTLKIFMAPEFFFRGRYGAYADIGYVTQIMEGLRGEIKKTDYANWLFINGTVIVATEQEQKKGGKGGGLYLENYALVQRGGAANGLSDFVVAKEFPSHVDFQHPGVSNLEWFDPATSKAHIGGEMRKNVMPVGGRQDPVLRDPRNQKFGAKAPRVSELTGGVIFTMEGITFGLEVCRDHLLGRLAHSQERGKVLIQLIPSAGAGIEEENIGCVADGIIFNVDGATPHTDVRVNNNGVQPKIAGSGQFGAGALEFYPPLDIPWPKPVRNDVAVRLNMIQSKLSGTPPTPWTPARPTGR